ncbi:hypothetical protein PULV_a0762 [Pseudoalteromonas ulvae UL12]|uniref:hypothetical protein n=1 Tax=Pseudoalteromonas ulvae TaxID=107327 RepID=UPI00186BB263|nr:hypothetical protein [Pseudoalteromonas ulvae]MBE0363128.1 hypothetical protein [Pseudoalteromonas ulvae UL12]
MTNEQLESIFEAWLITGELSEQESKALQADPVFAERFKVAQSMQSLSSRYQNDPVPRWDKQATWFDKNNKESVNWFNRGVVVCSMILVTFVVLNTQIYSSSQGIEVSFNPINTAERDQSQSEQIALLKEMLLEAQKSNQQQSWQLAQQAIDTTRKERREDLSALVEYLNEQRVQDQQLIKLQLNDVAEQVEFQESHKMANLLTGEQQ